jgi:hypothetical protein
MRQEGSAALDGTLLVSLHERHRIGHGGDEDGAPLTSERGAAGSPRLGHQRRLRGFLRAWISGETLERGEVQYDKRSANALHQTVA